MKETREKEEKDCSKHKWIPLLGIDKNKSVPTALFTCLKCGDLKVGVQTIKISRFRLDMGELPINNVAGMRLVEQPGTDLAINPFAVSGITISMTYGESLVPGDLLCFQSAKVWKASATHSVGKYPVMGLALETASSGSHLVLLHGIYNDAGRYNFGTVGGQIYISTAGGTETQVKPTAEDDVVQVVGIAAHADRIYFNPSMDYLTRYAA